MPLYINTNVASLNAQRNLDRSTNALGKTFSRLASGLRINSAKDDAAGLAISQRMTSQIRGLTQAGRNANDGISMAQVAEGALEETTNALQRMRELAVQAANGTNTSNDRLSLDLEVNQLFQEIQRISKDVKFNELSILNGSMRSGVAFQVGNMGGQTIKVSIAAMSVGGLVLGTAAARGVSIGSAKIASTAIMKLDSALDIVSRARSNLGAAQNRFEAVIANLSNVVENMSAARSRIMDADIAAETATLTRNAILQQAGTAVLAQANQQPQLSLKLLG